LSPTVEIPPVVGRLSLVKVLAVFGVSFFSARALRAAATRESVCVPDALALDVVALDVVALGALAGADDCSDCWLEPPRSEDCPDCCELCCCPPPEFDPAPAPDCG
jgi:hypothetical protein